MKRDTAIIKKLAVVAIILLVVTISVIAFVGVYMQDTNKLSNVVADYTYSTEFEGNREYKFVLDTKEESKEVYINNEGKICGEVLSETEENTDVEVVPETENTTVEEKDDTIVEGYTKESRVIKSNDESVLTQESYKKSRSIIENRLKDLEVNQYYTRLDEVTGNLVVELPDDEDANFLYEVINSKGEFAITDSQNGLELMNNSHLKNAKVGVSADTNGYKVYLQLDFNKEGKEILKNIRNEYVEKELETVYTNSEKPDDAQEPKTEINYIDIKLDNQILKKIYFNEKSPSSYIEIPISQNITTNVELNAATKSGNAIVTILNSGKMPNTYTLASDNFMQSSINSEVFNYIKIALIIAVVIISIVFVLKFKLNGLIGAVLNIGYLAMLSLVMRYTGVIITISCIITVIGIIIINFGFMYIFLKFMKEGIKAKYAYKDAMKKLYFSLVPVGIVAFVFTFMQNASVMGIGMILFWGIIIQALYSVIFIRNVYVLNEK